MLLLAAKKNGDEEDEKMPDNNFVTTIPKVEMWGAYKTLQIPGALSWKELVDPGATVGLVLMRSVTNPVRSLVGLYNFNFELSS